MMLPRVIAEIHQNTLLDNLTRIRQLWPGNPVLAMVKANAYGHGIVLVSQMLAPHVDYLGVATLDEAILLRTSGITSRIVIMSGVLDALELQAAFDFQCDLVIHTKDQLGLFKNFTLTTAAKQQPCALWLKVNTGMNRLGLPLQDAQKIYHALQHHPAFYFESTLTHFACADMPSHPLSHHQQAQIRAIAQTIPLPLSCCNSAGLLLKSLGPHHVIRPGLSLYGYWPLDTVHAPAIPLKPVMTLKARVLAIHLIHPGESVGYGATWCAIKPSRVAIIAMGYGDGFPQDAGPQTDLWVQGERVPLAGRVSMDSLAVDITDLKSPLQMGDYVQIWGPDHPLTDLAKSLQKSCYALLTGVSGRVVRQIK